MFIFYKEMLLDLWDRIKPHVCMRFAIFRATNVRKCLDCGRVDLISPSVNFDIKYGDK